jgi:serine/threonine protein kinase
VNLIGLRTGDGSQLLREIARGARARVYLASDGRRTFAVKAFGLREEARAERELRFGGGLEHPNLNPVWSRLELAGHPAVTAPFVPGRRLSAWLATADRAERIAVIDGLLDGLGYLHARGIVHRDVKPENVLVTRDGVPVLIDYDLSMRTTDLDARRTAAGTVAYLSPEQARGEPARPASDLYAAGVLLYRVLTGEVPFAGNVADVMEGHRSAEPPPPSAFDPALAAFDAPLARLLDKRPEARFDGADEARRALAEAAGRG